MDVARRDANTHAFGNSQNSAGLRFHSLCVSHCLNLEITLTRFDKSSSQGSTPALLSSACGHRRHHRHYPGVALLVLLSMIGAELALNPTSKRLCHTILSNKVLSMATPCVTKQSPQIGVPKNKVPRMGLRIRLTS